MTKTKLLARIVVALGLGLALLPRVSQATPAFARQMNLQCTVCHSEFPILTDFGRLFKLSGYTMSAGPQASDLPPIAFMLQPGWTHTNAGVDGGAAPRFKDNDNIALGQASFFYSGRLFGPYGDSLFGPTTSSFLNKIGIFYQETYDGVAHAWTWDNVELRYADSTTIFGKQAWVGVYVNNNPTMQDVWNTTPAWGYPFFSSPLQGGSAPAPMIAGAFAQQVIGAGVYTFIDNAWYLDVGAYHTLGQHFQNAMGVDPSGEAQISSLAPYWRLAHTTHIGNASWEVGTFGMAGSTYPGRDTSAGKDRFVDWGLDTQYQTTFASNDFTAMLTYMHENNAWHASNVLGNSTNANDDLWTVAATLHILHDKTYGFSAQYFVSGGSRDPLLYSTGTSGSPLTDGFVLEVDWLPFNKGGGPSFWPKSNIKLTAQYVIFNRYYGARSNYDGSGRNASDNNTLFLGAWIMF